MMPMAVMIRRVASDVRALRAAAQLLHRPAPRATAVVERLLAVQAQDLRAARLALRARCAGLRVVDVDRALSEERSLVVAWLMRGTLHLVRAEDHGWLLALTAPTRLRANRRRLGQEGVSEDDAERALTIVADALADEGPLTRPELAERIAAHGIRTAGQATPHLLARAALRGIAVLGPLRADGAHAFALRHDWLGPAPPAPARDAALAELARRYLAAHGPATTADLAAWSGLPLRDARAGLAAARVVERDDGLVDLARRAPAPARIPPRLLGAFDPYLLGWRDRAFAVPAALARRVHPGGGMLRAVATVDGLAVGTWSVRRGTVVLDAPDATDLQAEAADVARFLAGD
jgi:winged helix DNA-binding protein